MHPEISLYMTFSKVIGRQFFKNCLGLSPLGKQDIIPSLWVMGSSCLLNIQFIADTMYNFRSLQKNLKNSTVNPSLPGDLLFFIFFKTKEISFSVILPSRESEVYIIMNIILVDKAFGVVFVNWSSLWDKISHSVKL